MLLTNILLGFIIFFLVLICGVLTNIDMKLNNTEAEKMQRFYKSLMGSIKKEKGAVTKNVKNNS